MERNGFSSFFLKMEAEEYGELLDRTLLPHSLLTEENAVIEVYALWDSENLTPSDPDGEQRRLKREWEKAEKQAESLKYQYRVIAEKLEKNGYGNLIAEKEAERKNSEKWRNVKMYLTNEKATEIIKDFVFDPELDKMDFSFMEKHLPQKMLEHRENYSDYIWKNQMKSVFLEAVRMSLVALEKTEEREMPKELTDFERDINGLQEAEKKAEPTEKDFSQAGQIAIVTDFLRNHHYATETKMLTDDCLQIKAEKRLADGKEFSFSVSVSLPLNLSRAWEVKEYGVDDIQVACFILRKLKERMNDQLDLYHLAESHSPSQELECRFLRNDIEEEISSLKSRPKTEQEQEEDREPCKDGEFEAWENEPWEGYL